jgi:hypothetical protein
MHLEGVNSVVIYRGACAAIELEVSLQRIVFRADRRQPLIRISFGDKVSSDIFAFFVA